jgi:hypothetical protein
MVLSILCVPGWVGGQEFDTARLTFDRLVAKQPDKPARIKAGTRARGCEQEMAHFMAVPTRQLTQRHWEQREYEKHAEVMRRLWNEEFFLRYKADLERWKCGTGPRPAFPNRQWEGVVQSVDRWLATREQGERR